MIDLCAAGTSNGMRARMMAVVPDILEGFANVARWGQAMAARPAIQRATPSTRCNSRRSSG
jgi:hypothetical protein